MNLQVNSSDLLPAELSMGTVMLKVGDMAKVSAYYRGALGLEVVAEADGGQYLGRGTVPVVHLAPAPGLRVATRGEAGLYHTAILFETQAALAATVAAAAQYDPAAFVGAADHLVSEAFYFTDPEGNGIELYYDKPRDSWSWDDTASGREVRMASLALPPQAYFREHLTEEALADLKTSAAGVGHVHLQVGDTATAEAFYVDTLGFERTAGFHGQALFVSAGGYHHHMAMNVWNSRGAGPRRDTLGLGEVLISVPSADDVAGLADRLTVAGISSHHTGAELRFEDPWRNRLRVAVG
ncbi:VOC family protein [Arthrobacter gengyunqii]|uniref:VOC family protein n=1 Tax=Arthrobacter gengyunqii TaxID=2886940 RepID=A0A9X1M2U0_9MICC|nr:VOC family protein [Arthrobacter gengyunqii]MCC3265421.1 VOC family protein [Arthrobacter gengyunqii]MCC3269956.1 VOC family protein [Arthrobacter gengyunqii]UOY95118.1 VOC family protein [Arthrobacter gengyunqii]